MKLVKHKNGLNGRLNESGDVVMAIEEDGQKGIEIIKATADQLEDILPQIESVFKQLKAFFQSIFVQLPCFIKIEGKKFIRTEQRAPWDAPDTICYEWVSETPIVDGGDEFACIKILQFSGKTIDSAKAKCREELKATGRL